MNALSWSSYGAFAVFAFLVALAPGPDFAVLVKNAIVGGRSAGAWTAVGIWLASATQGSVAALGLGAFVVKSRPLFETIRWAGVAYLCYLGMKAIRSAWLTRADSPTPAAEEGPAGGRGKRVMQGFLTNATNPKVLVFYLAVLPQFLPPAASVYDALALANTMPAIGLVWAFTTVAALHSMGRWLQHRRVRRAIDGTTGLAMIGLAGKLAIEA